ncbi:MAG: hypothetical protein ACPGO5_05325 [Patescibacteria group bacterium]
MAKKGRIIKPKKSKNPSNTKPRVRFKKIGKEWHVLVSESTVHLLGCARIKQLFNYHVGTNGSTPGFFGTNYRFHVGQSKSAVESGVNKMLEQVNTLIANKRQYKKQKP